MKTILQSLLVSVGNIGIFCLEAGLAKEKKYALSV